MEKREMLTQLTELSNAAFGALMELHKAKHISNSVMGFYDLRGEGVKQPEWTEQETAVILSGYNAAATEHDIIHDYILRAVIAVQEIQTGLDALREQSK